MKKREKPECIGGAIRDDEGNLVMIDPATHPAGAKIKIMVAELETGKRYELSKEGA